MNYAYLNEARDVMLIDTVEWEIADIQLRVPAVTARIDGAPDGLLPKLMTGATDVQYHRLIEGSGGQVLQDYQLHENLDPLKAFRINALSDNTEAIFYARGYTWVKSEQVTFEVACHQAARDDLDAFATLDMRLGEAMPYPGYFPGKIDGVLVEVNSAAELTALCAGLGMFIISIKNNGELLKAQVKQCTTKAQIDLIIDNR